MVLDAVPGSPLNTLHLHGDKVYLDLFYNGWPATVYNYSQHGTNVPVAEVRRRCPGVIMAGLDEVNFRTLTEDQLHGQWQAAREAAGSLFILAPGCSVPNDTKDGELSRLVKVLGA